AVGEMYRRIHDYLMDQAGAGINGTNSINQNAANALGNFHKARISTLDSFSANIARTAASRYGISPDFSSDDTALRDLAKEAALRFVLDNRKDPGIRTLLADHKIRKIAEEIFAQIVLRHGSISRPLNLDEMISSQKDEIIKIWHKNTNLIKEITGKIIEALHTLAGIKKSINFTKSLEEILFASPPPLPPDIAPIFAENIDWNTDLSLSEIRQQIKKYFDYYSMLMAIRAPGIYGDDYAPLVEYFRLLKGRNGNGLYHILESVANYALNFDLCSGIFDLIKEFQDKFNAKKRASSFLSFNDIARLAVDALKDHPDIRNSYKDSTRMIMVDEFQDNNALQRDLIFLLAENPERIEKGNPAPAELEKNRMFFVGDEKQSIYRFRGADVAVFRSLSRTIGSQDFSGGDGGGSFALTHNYRSQPGLIAAFNHIFSNVFLPSDSEIPDYEAAYDYILAPEKIDENPIDEAQTEQKPLAHFCFLNKEELSDDDTDGIKSHDLEAAFIAGKIRDMVQKKEKIPKRTGQKTEWVECAWGDFAVLERSYAHQNTLEKYFREFGIPYNTDRPSGLFNDAPILDLRAYLRLLVYPEDRIAYAALIRSPFVRLSDLSLAACLLSEHKEPFAEENEPIIPKDDIALYRRAKERYKYLREISRTLTATELITKLWFEEGYRYETLWAESAQVYEGLFDLFFSLASESDARGKSLAEFIEYLDDVMNHEEKPDSKDIPGEGESGVRIMSIHKSKGLEFPVVFIFDCTHSGNSKNSSELASFHEQYGIILNIPQAEELPLGGNYFRRILIEEEKAKDIAELRRLLYVAMTRAEYQVFLTFTLPKQTKEEKKECDFTGMKLTEEIISRRLAQLDEKSEGIHNKFLKLLAGPITVCPRSLCSLQTIPVLSRAEIQRYAAHSALFSGEEKKLAQRPQVHSQREAALAAAPFYETAEILPEGKAGPASLEASQLKTAPSRIEAAVYDADINYAPTQLDILLKKAGLDAAEAGTVVHAVLEARLSGKPCFVPPKIRSRADDENSLQNLIAHAEILAEAFIALPLGKRWAAAIRQEPEFSVITAVDLGKKKIAITGQIDLLFEERNEVVVVDFKTDKMENPEAHYGQLAAYHRAAGDIFCKPVSVWLFYLRSGKAVEVTERITRISLEELAAAYV
ncbi:MAG: UvrD-helicase domain-containing protein, partial [Treponema sp.]|nr:UvrD-helicase domain-containing protein [Treponema sp.]